MNNDNITTKQQPHNKKIIASFIIGLLCFVIMNGSLLLFIVGIMTGIMKDSLLVNCSLVIGFLLNFGGIVPLIGLLFACLSTKSNYHPLVTVSIILNTFMLGQGLLQTIAIFFILPLLQLPFI
jgi:hypothetical protein